MMRDLLYLSENKMRALVPQLPGQLRRRLGFEAGLNAGVVSAKATLQSEPQPSSIALLDSVVEMIEREKGSRWRTDNHLRAGDWIQFEEEFRGDGNAAGLLDEVLAERGDLDELRARADAGDRKAAGQLAEVLARQGRKEDAERLRRFGLNPDGSIASG